MENKLHILYAEDDELGAELIKILLEEHGFMVDIANDGEEAWNTYKCQKPDILLLDLDMPRKDGIEVTRLIRQKDPQTHIIIYTSHAEPEREITALDAGADEFIPKERPSEVLIVHLKNIRRKMIAHMNVPHLYQLSPITTYNAASHVLTIREERIPLPQSEARLLHLLCAKSNQLVKVAYLASGIWGKATINKEKEIKKFVSLVRKTLDKDPSISIQHQKTTDTKGYILITN